jgi:hypothetical protein
MKHYLMVALFLFASLTAVGQTKPHKAAPASHRLQVLRQLHIGEVEFRVRCARSTNHADNQQCTNEMLRDFHNTYSKLSLIEIPIPTKYSPRKVVLMFKEDLFMDDDTITLTVYETENNGELYSNSRSRLLLGNDLTKLLAGYAESLEKE